MNNQARISFYNKVKQKKIEFLDVVEIDLKKSYNKKIILDRIEHTDGIGRRGVKYLKSSGAVWCLFNEVDGKIVCYDVCETSSVCQEMIDYYQYLTVAKRDVRKNIYKSFKRKVYTRYKTQQIYKSLPKNKKVKFGVICYSNDKEARLKVEMEAAAVLKATWWSPNPVQNKIITDLYVSNN